MPHLVFNMFGYTFSFNLFKRWARTKGIKSIVAKDRHVLFIDIDNIELKDLVLKMKELDKRHNLGDTFIFKTHEDNLHWHVICPSIFSTKEIVEILANFNLEYIIYGLKNNGWVLRILPKDSRSVSIPVYTYFIPSLKKTRARSISHLRFLQKYYYCFEHTEEQIGDIKGKLIIEEYSTPNSGWCNK